MNELVGHVSKVLKKHIPATHFPLWLGMMGGDHKLCPRKKILCHNTV